MGWTEEILRLGEADNWSLRLSIAEIDADAEFSSFPGIDRELVLLQGAGLRLRFDQQQTITLQQPGASHRFSGEQAVRGELLNGPTRDFNVMWRRDHLQVDLQQRSLSGGLWLSGEDAAAWALHLLSGSASCELGGQRHQLQTGDSAWLRAGGGGLALEGHAEMLAIRISA